MVSIPSPVGPSSTASPSVGSLSGNPYGAAPGASLSASPAVAPARALPTIHRIDARDLNWALREGMKDFRAMRGDIILAGLIYPTVALLAAALALGGNLIPIIFPMAAAFSLMGPLIAIGFYELARRRESGMDAGWSHFLDPLRGANRMQILGLAAGLVVVALAWLLMAQTIYEGTLGTLAPGNLSGFLSMLFTTAEGWRMIVLGNIAGLAFALVTLATMLVSFPMMVDKTVHASDAVETSLRASFHNPMMTLRWGVTVAVLLALACIPLFLGLAVVLPVLGYASWHLYTRMVER
ncbi:DUF2189 domain-containing protein [Sphingobium sufflavum]|uniref:DUF2189 domain-containing protein n=1 Tax=Sphingobium sufflavum TaxID=1129547 RepID=UPI001F4151BD|nr:DUF2189 domain-containing protein [Sphingobium sufflavum]MCE7798593.1 DUF2189 domain-containing protein [Sphingobium sufflavum]